jgi:hypothetical protein
MISLDLNKALHPRVVDLLLGFIPGLFFVICALSENPQRARQSASIAGPDHYYTAIFVALFLAFVIGSAFVLWVRSIQMTIGYVYSEASRRLPKWRAKRTQKKYAEILQEMRQQSQEQAQGTPPPPPQPPKNFSKLHQSQLEESQLFELRSRLQSACGRAAQALLERYGVAVDPNSQYWQFNGYAWMLVLGESRPSDRLGNPLPVSLHAVGWSGLAATHLAPHLRTLPFVVFCLFLIAFGLFHDYHLAKKLYDPVFGWMLKLRRTLDELKVMAEKPGDSDPGKPSGSLESEG